MFGESDKGLPVRKCHGTLAVNDGFHFGTTQSSLNTQFSVATMASHPPALRAPPSYASSLLAEPTNHPLWSCALSCPWRTSFFFFPFFSLLCAVGSHRLLLSIFQLVAADLYLNPNICPIQCELPIQPHAWLCLCSFEQTEWATWLCNADITWSLVVFVRVAHMWPGRTGPGISFQFSQGEGNELYLPQHMCKLHLCSSE